MTHKPSSEEIVVLTHKVVALYLQESPDQTLGEWVLSKFYKNTALYEVGNLRDFSGAQRTIDGRYYLGGMLRSGTLSPEPLLEAVRTIAISATSRNMVI